VRITRSRQTIGEELPRPGTGVFQRTFWVADHVSGYVLPLTIPWPEGPRQRGQYRAPSPSTEIICTPASWPKSHLDGHKANANEPSTTRRDTIDIAPSNAPRGVCCLRAPHSN
jgi:hypothetical protein